MKEHTEQFKALRIVDQKRGVPMRIGVIQASSQSEKNSLLFETVKTYAKYATVLNFGCTPEEKEKYSYIEIRISRSCGDRRLFRTGHDAGL